MRDYTFFDECVDRLTGDVYAQPPDDGHTAWALETLTWLIQKVYIDIYHLQPPFGEGRKVLDVGCGQAFMSNPFVNLGFDWTGVTIGADYLEAQQYLAQMKLNQEKVLHEDMTFLPFADNEFDLIFARHVLEHSPFPIITLMEWRRVVKKSGWLCLVAPAPHWWLHRGRNHYSIVPKENLDWWLLRSGWEPVHQHVFHNREELFLRHLTVIDESIRRKSVGEIMDEARHILDRYPKGPVEYRYICSNGEEQVE